MLFIVPGYGLSKGSLILSQTLSLILEDVLYLVLMSGLMLSYRTPTPEHG